MSGAANQDRRSLEADLRGSARQMLFSNEVVDEFVANATLSDMRAVAGLMSRQMEVRARNQLEKRMRRAKFPAIKSFDGYDLATSRSRRDTARRT